MNKMWQIVVYVPTSHLDIVKAALFSSGAGKIGNYDSCSWQTLGEGQFRALSGSNPYIGQTGAVEKVPEWRLEMVCEDSCLRAAMRAMKEAHPYETPAYSVWPIQNPE